MNENKSNFYTQSHKFLCDWTDEKKYLIHYKLFIFYVRHGLIVDKAYEVIPFRQQAWLKYYLLFNTKKALAEIEIEKKTQRKI